MVRRISRDYFTRFHKGPVAALTFPFYNRPDPANHKKTNQEELT